MYQLPKKYVTAEEEALRFLDRMCELRIAYQDVEYRDSFDYKPSAERAALKRASLDLSKVLAQMRATVP